MHSDMIYFQQACKDVNTDRMSDEFFLARASLN